MMDILQKFIFGEVFTTGNLSLKQREMITCVTLATMQTLPQLKAHAGAALNVGVTPVELRESAFPWRTRPPSPKQTVMSRAQPFRTNSTTEESPP